MSSLALMRWLESAPNRYDAGDRLVVNPGDRYCVPICVGLDVPGGELDRPAAPER